MNLRRSCFKYKSSQWDGRRDTFSFSRKIYKLAPVLISGWFNKSFTFMQFASDNGTTAQLQICSSARNVSLLPVHRENYKNNYFCNTNTHPPGKHWKTINKTIISANETKHKNIRAVKIFHMIENFHRAHFLFCKRPLNCRFRALYVCSKDRICGSMYFNYVFCNAQNLTRVLFCEGLFCNLLRSAII